jgi:glyoxylase-like metal-dependent hydrolase (beta-lactamase superfamily II)
MIKLYCFHGGYEVTDKSIFTLGVDIGVEVKLPYQYFLIEHSNGRLMFDTGANPAAIRNPENYSPSMLFSPHVVEEDLAVNRLAGIGLKPEQIDLVANSHLHYDHAGGNCFFPDATFLEQFDELQGAMFPEPWGGLVPINYAREDFDLPVTYELLDGDYDVFGDQSVVLIRTPGHTRGHQSMVIRFSKDNVFILASDACYLRQNLEYMILSAVCFDQHQMYISYRRLRDLQRKENAFIIPGHDIEVWESLKKAPEFYS